MKASPGPDYARSPEMRTFHRPCRAIFKQILKKADGSMLKQCGLPPDVKIQPLLDSDVAKLSLESLQPSRQTSMLAAHACPQASIRPSRGCPCFGHPFPKTSAADWSFITIPHVAKMLLPAPDPVSRLRGAVGARNSN